MGQGLGINIDLDKKVHSMPEALEEKGTVIGYVDVKKYPEKAVENQLNVI